MSAPEFSSAKKEIAKLSRETATRTRHGRCPKVTVQGRAAPELEVARRRNKDKNKGQCHRSNSKSGYLPFNAVKPNPFAYRRYRSSPRSSTAAGNVLRWRNNRAVSNVRTCRRDKCFSRRHLKATLWRLFARACTFYWSRTLNRMRHERE